MDKTLAERMLDSGVRISGMWPLQGLTYVLPSKFEDAIIHRVDDSDFPDEIKALMGKDFDAENGEDWSDLAGDAFVKGMFGFIVEADCVVYMATSKTSASSSWGTYRTRLFYGATAEQALEAACDWGAGAFSQAVAKYEEAEAPKVAP